MGYSQRAHTWYGWVTPMTTEISNWQSNIDYKKTKGFMSIDLDSKQCVFGVELFISSDVRWDVLQGFEEFTIVEAEVQFETWKSELSSEMKVFVDQLAEDNDPKFYTFCTFL